MSRLAQLLAVRPGEGRRIALLASLLAAIEAARGAAQVATDTLFLSRVGVTSLPYVYVALGAIGLLVGVAYLAAVGRLRSPNLPAVLLAIFALLLLAERLAMASGAEALYPVAWLTVNVINALLLTMVWAIAGSVLDTRQARRLFPLLMSATIVGGFAGTVTAGPIASLVGVESLLLVPVVLLTLGALLARHIGRTYVRTPSRRSAEVAPSVTRELRAGFDFVRGSPLFRSVGLAYVLFSILLFAVSYSYLGAVSAASANERQLATTLGLVSATVTAASLVVALVFARPVYARFGVATTALSLPLVYLGGFGVWLLSFGFGTAVAVCIAQQVVQRGLSNAAWSALATTVPAERRSQVLAFLDGVPGQIGTSVSGLMLLAATYLLDRSQLFMIGFATAALCTIVVFGLRRRYGQSLLTTLRSGLGEQVLEGVPGISTAAQDPQLVSALREAIGDASVAVRRLAVELLPRLGSADAMPVLATATADPDPGVRRAALAGLEALAPRGAPGRDVIEEVEGRLTDDDGTVRAAGVSALEQLDRDRVVAAVPALQADADPRVRAGAAIALVHAGEEDRPHAMLVALLESPQEADRVAGLDAVAVLHGHVPTPAMFDGLADPSPLVRRAAVRAAVAVDAGSGDPLAALARALADDDAGVREEAATAIRERGDRASLDVALETLRTGTPPAQLAALDALGGHSDLVADELIAWSLDEIERVSALRTAHRGLHADPEVQARPEGPFVCALLEERERSILERLLGALSVLGVPGAMGPLRRSLWAADPEVRAQAVEAIDALGDRRITHSMIALMESDEQGPVRGSEETLQELIGDPDPWIRTLAFRLLAGRLSTALVAVAGRMRDDPDPRVRAAYPLDGAAGGDMPKTGDTLDLLQRVLFLRQVPIFARLAPEDLERIADAAYERLYQTGDELFHQGELGDELVIIVEGSVRVVRIDDGEERLVRDFATGDYVGEMAVLREMPRAATVTAQAPVRGLVINGAAFTAILRERPDAAMALLRSLADRLSVM
jgi:HEAT repeat protein/ATP/ADP translocase